MLAAQTLAPGARRGLPEGPVASTDGVDPRLSGQGSFWYAGRVKSSVSIALFLLLSGFFLTALLGAIEHSRKLLGLSGVFLVVVVCVIVFLTPVQLPPSLRLGFGGDDTDTTDGPATAATAGVTVTSTVTSTATSTTGPPYASPARPATTSVTSSPVTSIETSPAVSVVTTEASGVRTP